MSIKPTITEVHERRYQFELSPEQVQDAIIAACLKAADLTSVPDGVEFTMQTGSGLQPINLRFTVPVVGTTSPAPMKAHEAAAAPQPAASASVSAPDAAEKLKAAPAATTAPVRASAKSARPMAWAGLTSQERSIVLHLERLPDTFSPVDDLNIAQCLTSSVKAPAIALEMDITAEEVVARWKAMWCSAVLESSRTPTIEGQKRLLAALRYRVETEG